MADPQVTIQLEEGWTNEIKIKALDPLEVVIFILMRSDQKLMIKI